MKMRIFSTDLDGSGRFPEALARSFESFDSLKKLRKPKFWRVVSGRWPGQRGSATPSEAQTNQPPPRAFSQPRLGQVGPGRVASGRWSSGSATPSVTQTALCRWFPCWQTRVANKGCQQPSKKHVGTLARSRGNGAPTVTQTNL